MEWNLCLLKGIIIERFHVHMAASAQGHPTPAKGVVQIIRQAGTKGNRCIQVPENLDFKLLVLAEGEGLVSLDIFVLRGKGCMVISQ